MDMFIIIVVVT